MRFIYTKTFAILFGCLVLVAVFLFLDSRGFLDPVRYVVVQAPRPVAKVLNSVTRPVKQFFVTVYSLRSIARENTNLKARITELEQQVVAANQLRLENETLKKELGFASRNSLNLQSCTVFALDPQGVTDTMIISCGEDSGIKEGELVISSGYLVGKVIHVGKYNSTILLITNSQSSVDSKVSRSGVEGAVKGSFGSGLTLELVPQTADLKAGDEIVTAGINSITPANVLIGTLGDNLSKSTDLFRRFTVVSPLNFHNIDFVFVAKE